jgi:hypothetical protein
MDEQLLLLLIETFPDVEISKTGNAKKIIDFVESQRQATIAEKDKEFRDKLIKLQNKMIHGWDDDEVQSLIAEYEYSPSQESKTDPIIK